MALIVVAGITEMLSSDDGETDVVVEAGERTDELIDQIVYELYGLTDEEIEIVGDAVGE